MGKNRAFSLCCSFLQKSVSGKLKAKDVLRNLKPCLCKEFNKTGKSKVNPLWATRTIVEQTISATRHAYAIEWFLGDDKSPYAVALVWCENYPRPQALLADEFSRLRIGT